MIKLVTICQVYWGWVYHVGDCIPTFPLLIWLFFQLMRCARCFLLPWARTNTLEFELHKIAYTLWDDNQNWTSLSQSKTRSSRTSCPTLLINGKSCCGFDNYWDGKAIFLKNKSSLLGSRCQHGFPAMRNPRNNIFWSFNVHRHMWNETLLSRGLYCIPRSYSTM